VELQFKSYAASRHPTAFRAFRHAYRVQCFSTTSSNTKTHVDDQGKAAMVDVSAKDVTKCEAIACATVEVGAEITKLITRIVSKRAMHWRWHK